MIRRLGLPRLQQVLSSTKPTTAALLPLRRRSRSLHRLSSSQFASSHRETHGLHLKSGRWVHGRAAPHPRVQLVQQLRQAISIKDFETAKKALRSLITIDKHHPTPLSLALQNVSHTRDVYRASVLKHTQQLLTELKSYESIPVAENVDVSLATITRTGRDPFSRQWLKLTHFRPEIQVILQEERRDLYRLIGEIFATSEMMRGATGIIQKWAEGEALGIESEEWDAIKQKSVLPSFVSLAGHDQEVERLIQQLLNSSKGRKNISPLVHSLLSRPKIVETLASLHNNGAAEAQVEPLEDLFRRLKEQTAPKQGNVSEADLVNVTQQIFRHIAAVGSLTLTNNVMEIANRSLGPLKNGGQFLSTREQDRLRLLALIHAETSEASTTEEQHDVVSSLLSSLLEENSMSREETLATFSDLLTYFISQNDEGQAVSLCREMSVRSEGSRMMREAVINVLEKVLDSQMPAKNRNQIAKRWVPVLENQLLLSLHYDDVAKQDPHVLRALLRCQISTILHSDGRAPTQFGEDYLSSTTDANTERCRTVVSLFLSMQKVNVADGPLFRDCIRALIHMHEYEMIETLFEEMYGERALSLASMKGIFKVAPDIIRDLFTASNRTLALAELEGSGEDVYRTMGEKILLDRAHNLYYSLGMRLRDPLFYTWGDEWSDEEGEARETGEMLHHRALTDSFVKATEYVLEHAFSHFRYSSERNLGDILRSLASFGYAKEEPTPEKQNAGDDSTEHHPQLFALEDEVNWDPDIPLPFRNKVPPPRPLEPTPFSDIKRDKRRDLRDPRIEPLPPLFKEEIYSTKIQPALITRVRAVLFEKLVQLIHQGQRIDATKALCETYQYLPAGALYEHGLYLDLLLKEMHRLMEPSLCIAHRPRNPSRPHLLDRMPPLLSLTSAGDDEEAPLRRKSIEEGTEQSERLESLPPTGKVALPSVSPLVMSLKPHAVGQFIAYMDRLRVMLLRDNISLTALLANFSQLAAYSLETAVFVHEVCIRLNLAAGQPFLLQLLATYAKYGDIARVELMVEEMRRAGKPVNIAAVQNVLLEMYMKLEGMEENAEALLHKLEYELPTFYFNPTTVELAIKFWQEKGNLEKCLHYREKFHSEQRIKPTEKALSALIEAHLDAIDEIKAKRRKSRQDKEQIELYYGKIAHFYDELANVWAFPRSKRTMELMIKSFCAQGEVEKAEQMWTELVATFHMEAISPEVLKSFTDVYAGQKKKAREQSRDVAEQFSTLRRLTDLVYLPMHSPEAELLLKKMDTAL